MNCRYQKKFGDLKKIVYAIDARILYIIHVEKDELNLYEDLSSHDGFV